MKQVLSRRAVGYAVLVQVYRHTWSQYWQSHVIPYVCIRTHVCCAFMWEVFTLDMWVMLKPPVLCRYVYGTILVRLVRAMGLV